eukprot:14866404-Alexandrium_andersonii.AAC.1
MPSTCKTASGASDHAFRVPCQPRSSSISPAWASALLFSACTRSSRWPPSNVTVLSNTCCVKPES